MNGSALPLLRAEEIRAHESALCAQGRSPAELMESAGAAVFKALRQQWPTAHRIGILLGSGQNAGDGWVVARLAEAAGLCVTVFGWWDESPPTGAAAAMAQRVPLPAGARRTTAEDLAGSSFEVIVDAGFGLGFRPEKPVPPSVAGWMAAVTECRARGSRVLAIDLPSGLCADTGRVADGVIAADLTVCVLGLKVGLFTGQGAAVRGQVVLALLGAAMPLLSPSRNLLWTVPALPPKPRAGHKGVFGTVLVVAGNRGMAGAARMAAEAALRSGAGKVIVATHPAHASVLGMGCPELIVQAVDDAAAMQPALAQAQAIVLGCGLGASTAADDWAQRMIDAVWGAPLPLVVDADGLIQLGARAPRTAATVLTPHPGEAARLLGCATADIERDRLAAARALSERFAAQVLLKGAGSVLSTAAGLQICGRGDPALATAGAGDVLAGVIGGLLALGLPAEEALARAVCWHAQAGEALAYAEGAWGAAATDLLPVIRALINGRPVAGQQPEVVVWP